MAKSLSQLHPVTELLREMSVTKVPNQKFLFNAETRPENQGQPLLQKVDIDAYGGEVKVRVLDRRAKMGAASSDGRYASHGARTPVQAQTMSTVDVLTIPYKWEQAIDFEEIRRSQLPGGEEEAALDTVKQVMYVEREKRLADAIFNTGSFTNAAVAATFGAKWSAATGTPLEDISTIGETFRTQTKGIPCDTAVMDYTTAGAISRNAEARGLYFGTASGAAGGLGRPVPMQGVREIVADLLGIPVGRVYIGEAFRDTANPGQSESSSGIWSDNFGVYCLNTPLNQRRAQASMKIEGVALADFFDLDEDVGAYDEKQLRRIVYADESRVFQLLTGDYGLFYTDAV